MRNNISIDPASTYTVIIGIIKIKRALQFPIKFLLMSYTRIFFIFVLYKQLHQTHF